MSETKTIELVVSTSFEDEWLLHTATPEERTTLLTFACSLPRKLHTTFGEEDLRKIFQTASNEAESRLHASITDLETQNAAAQKHIRDLEVKLQAKEHELELTDAHRTCKDHARS